MTPNDADVVRSREHLLAFIRQLAAERHLSSGDRCANVGSCLEAMAAWIEDIDGFFKNRGENIPRAADWRLVAHRLAAAAMYE